MKKIWIPFLLALLTAFGLFTRVVSLSHVPRELHRDELSIAYTAYSILETGYDENGAGPFPFFFESFGDYKLPGLIYFTSVFIKLFGLTPLAARLGTALLGSLLIPVSYLFVKELFASTRFSIATAFLVAFSIWHTFLSRTAYEPIGSLTLFVLGLTFLLRARKQVVFYLFAAIFLGLSFLFYNVALLLAPVLVCLSLLVFRKEYFEKGKFKTLAGFALIFLVIGGVYLTMSAVTSGKLETTIISPQKYVNTYNDNYFLLIQTPVESHRARQIIASPIFEFIRDFLKGYLAAFNPVYLFVEGGKNGWHSLSPIGFGNLAWFVLPLSLYGGYCVVRGTIQRQKPALFLLGYLLLSPIPDALTIDAPVTNRLLDFHFLVTVFAALGIYSLWRTENKKILLSFLISGLSATYLLFISRYFFMHQWKLDPLWLPGYRKVAQRISELEHKYDVIFIDSDGTSNANRTIDSSYIFQAFYSKTDPTVFQETVVWADSEGLKKALQFDKYRYDFAQLDSIATDSAKRGLLVSRNPQFAKKYLVIESNEGEVGADVWYFFDINH